MNGRWKKFITSAGWLLMLLLLALPARASTWTHTTVDNTATVTGKNLSLAVDPNGKLYIGYLDTTSSSAPFLKYATNASGSWVVESLTNILPYAANASTATVFTPGGPRIMAYTYHSTQQTNYMYRAARKVTGDGWQLQDIAGGISPLDGSIQPAMSTVSSSTQTGSAQYMGFTYITYNDGTKLWYANEKDMAWYNISAAGSSAGNGGVQSDLAIDNLGNVHVIYIDALGNMMYKMNPTAPGQATTIVDNTYAISNPSIGIDSNNTIHLVYTVLRSTNSASQVWYTSKTTTGSWSTPVSIGVCGKTGGYTTLKVDSVNNVHVSWYDSQSGYLTYREKQAGTWLTEESTVAAYGQYGQMVIDQYNNVNIAYYNSSTTSLDVVTKVSAAIDASPSPLLFGYVPQYSSSQKTLTITNKGNDSQNLTINSIGNPSLSDFSVVSNGCSPLPKTLAVGASCTISYQFTPSVPGAQTATVSIGSTDPNIPTKTVTLKGTATTTANHTIMAGTVSAGGTISPAGAVSVADGVNQTFTITPDPGYLVAMVAVDPAGMTQAQLMAASKGMLPSYTFNEVTADHSIYVMFMPYVSVSTWSATEIDNTGTATGKNCSIAVDPDNNLHIGYLDTSSSSAPFLKYATNASGSWALTSLKDILPNAMNASTATVYTPGGPRIMAYSYDSATLAYKYQAARKILGDGWQLQDIGGGINPMTGQPEPAMTTVSTSTQTGALQYMGFTFITFNNGDYLQYANERDMAWYKITNAGTAAGNGGIQSDLTIDSSGNIHAVYVDALNNLMYAMNPKNPGEAVTIKDTSGVISNPNIAITPDNTLHVVYMDTTGASGANGVMYIKKPAGGSWSTPIVIGPAGTYGGYTAIKADSIGGIHITYYYSASTSYGKLMYQTILPNGARGSEETIKDPNNSNNYGQYSVIAIDNNNIVNIAYYNVSRTSLVVTRQQTYGINATPSPMYFGNVLQSSSDTTTVTVTNKGTSGNLHIRGSASISGTNASEFSIDSSTCTDGLSIAPGSAGCTITVRFSPTSEGTKSANLIIGSDDLIIPYKSVPLSGTSFANDPTYTITAGVTGVGGRISPAGVVPVAGSDSQTFTITPDPGYIVAFVAVDPAGMTQQDLMAASQGALSSYTFNQVSANHSVFVVFTQAIPVTSWNVTEVDNTATATGKYCSITNDLAGKLYVGYLDTTSSTAPLLKYATNRSGSWVYETVTTIPSVTTAGTATVFSEGIGPRIMAYSYNSTTGARKYGAARKWTETDNHWELQWIAGDYFPPEYGGAAQPSIFTTTTTTFTGATQYNGYTFISYTDGYNLWYANERDFFYYPFEQTPPGTWPTGPGSVAGGGSQSDLVLDSTGVIHIIYINSSGYLRYGTGTGSSYSEATVRTEVVSDPSITIDGNDTLHVSYIKSGRVMYLNKTAGGSWSTPYDIGPCGTNGQYTSIKANGLNIVHLAYYAYNSTNAKGQLMYVTRSAEGQWSSPQAVPDTSANVGQYAALTVDMHHNVNIAYHDVTRTSLKVASRLIPVINGPTSVNFGTVSPNSQTYQTINISNVGQDNLRIGTATIDGTNAADFTIFSNTCNDTTLIPGGTGCSVVVSFVAGTTGAKTAKLHITSNDRYTPDLQSTMTATVLDTTLYTVQTSVNAEAGTHCSVTPGGNFSIPSGGSQRFTFNTDLGFFISDVKVDGVTNASAMVNGYYDFINVLANHTIVLTCESFIKVGANFIGTLSAAMDEAAFEGQPIKARHHTFIENLVFNNAIGIIFGGGYDPAFTSQTGATTIKGYLEITQGGIEVQNVGIE